MESKMRETYCFNCMLARALLDKLSEEERQIPLKWLEKLSSINKDASRQVLRTRNTYTWKLLLDLQRKELQTPFDKEPNEGELITLSEDVIKKLEMESSQSDVEWAKEILRRTEDTSSVSNVVPTDFLDVQPIPNLGAICYAAVFGEI